MISVTDAKLIFFQWAKINPAAISMKTGMTGDRGLKISIVDSVVRWFLENGQKHQGQCFAEIGDRAKVMEREDRMAAMKQGAA